MLISSHLTSYFFLKFSIFSLSLLCLNLIANEVYHILKNDLYQVHACECLPIVFIFECEFG